MRRLDASMSAWPLHFFRVVGERQALLHGTTHARCIVFSPITFEPAQSLPRFRFVDNLLENRNCLYPNGRSSLKNSGIQLATYISQPLPGYVDVIQFMDENSITEQIDV